MKKSLLFFGLFLFSIFLVPSGVFADSVKLQYSDYSLNFSEEERQKAIDSILSDSNLNNFSKDSYFFTILYTASYSDVTINSTDDELQKRSKYILLVSPKSWNNGRPLVINAYNRFDIYASNAYYFDNDFINLGEHSGSIYHFLNIATGDYSISFPLLYTSSDLIYNNSGKNFDYYYGDELLFSLLYKENFLEKCKKYEPPKSFEINSIHKISLLLLGDGIPNEFSFIYLIFDYLLVISFVIVLISPFVIVVRILRWS